MAKGVDVANDIMAIGFPPKRHNILCCISEYYDQHQANRFIFTPLLNYRCYFSFGHRLLTEQ